MTVRIRVSSPHLSVRQERGKPRRAFIYPHRSIRAIPASAVRWVLAGSIAAGLTIALSVFLSQVLRIHNQLCLAILQISGIGVGGTAAAQLFASSVIAPIPVVAVPELSSRPLEFWALFSAATLIILELYRRIPFARSFFLFLLTLLVVTAGIILWHPSSQFGSVEFASMWLRTEVLVWLVMPSITAALYVLTQPGALFGFGWAVLTQLYGFVWSAIRLAFGIAMVHYTGILFAPIFWFAGGLLADVIYVVVFYSVSVQRTAGNWWGKRAQ
jgi:hypothetical protein